MEDTRCNDSVDVHNCIFSNYLGYILQLNCFQRREFQCHSGYVEMKTVCSKHFLHMCYLACMFLCFLKDAPRTSGQ